MPWVDDVAGDPPRLVSRAAGRQRDRRRAVRRRRPVGQAAAHRAACRGGSAAVRQPARQPSATATSTAIASSTADGSRRSSRSASVSRTRRFATRTSRCRARSMAPYGQLRVTVDVTNTGDVAGDEVVQLYVATGPSQVDARGARPARFHPRAPRARADADGAARAGGTGARVLGRERERLARGADQLSRPGRDRRRASCRWPRRSSSRRGDDHAPSDGDSRCSRSTASRYSSTRS